MAYPIVQVSLPKTGWQLLEVQAGIKIWRHRCVACSDELLVDAEPDRLGPQLVELCELHGVPPLCSWCLIAAAGGAGEAAR